MTNYHDPAERAEAVGRLTPGRVRRSAAPSASTSADTCPTCGATEPNDWTAGLHAGGFCPDPFHANPADVDRAELIEEQFRADVDAPEEVMPSDSQRADQRPRTWPSVDRAEGVPESTQVPSKGSERPAETVNLLLSRPSPSAPTSADVDAALDTAVRPETKSVITGHNGADVDAETVSERLEYGSGLTGTGWWGEARAALDRIQARLRTAEAERDEARADAVGVRAVNEQIVELGEPLRAENERLRGALKFYAERDDLNNYVAVAALKETTSSTGGNIPPETENTDFPVGTMGRTDGLTDDMGG